ncbi:hypothetical protein KOI35_14935 [Actinoplanes bogorensis]|uniref:Uncharacterized protein n=1 Tax=Paractinoplanes bogorensis TaxID=1610840 RepID=A0ABS5YMV1_9ACTN|nr:hypothetical protein [Actinoplanes bogorensis]MBU2664795.1 hypothetical protein [Actinoplanes bogorensis]
MTGRPVLRLAGRCCDWRAIRRGQRAGAVAAGRRGGRRAGAVAGGPVPRLAGRRGDL